MKKPLIFSTLALCSLTLQAQVNLQCSTQNTLFPKQQLSTQSDALDVLADQSEITNKDHYLLTGNVSLHSSEYFLAADTVRIQKSDKTSYADGNVRFQDATLMLNAKAAELRKQNEQTHVTLSQADFHYPQSRINGYADKVVSDGQIQVFDQANYTLCPLGRGDWRLNADQITLNAHTNRGQAEDVTLEFLGLPIFYLPSHEWVLEGRGSGFLSPSVASYNEAGSKSGYQVRIPYYFNLAPDRDFLLTLNHLSSRGEVLEGKYRQLLESNDWWEQGRVEVEGHYLADDAIDNTKRWLLKTDLDVSLNAKTTLGVHTHRVSDADYFKEVAHEHTSIDSLISSLNLAYQDPEQALSMSLLTEDEQLVNSGNAAYIKAPELALNKRINALEGRSIDLSLISTKFKHDTATDTGVRTHAQANFSKEISTPAYQLKPTLSLLSTNYALDNQADKSRSMARFNLDGKLFLEREIQAFSKDLIQTLVPRFSYHYTPDKAQSSLPNYDSEAKSDSYSNLFSANKYTGLDRIGKANDVTLGVESEFIDANSGETYVTLKAAQTLYKDDISANNGLRNYSDIAASANFKSGPIVLNTEIQYDPETNQIDKKDSSIAYKIDGRQFLTLVHHDSSSEESAELYGAYPLTDRVHVFAGVNRSLSSDLTNKQVGGVAYESCCWALRLAHFKEYSGSDYDHVTEVELVFKGLASTTPSLRNKLQKDIPNYLADLDDY